MKNMLRILSFTTLLVIGAVGAELGFGNALICPSDSLLSERFDQSRRHFIDIQNMMKTDGWHVSYIGRGVVESTGLQLSEERKTMYLAELKRIGAVSLSQNMGEMMIWYWNNSVSIASRSRSKGIAFFPNIDNHRYRLLTDLDGLEKSSDDGVYLKTLGQGWFVIYLQSS